MKITYNGNQDDPQITINMSGKEFVELNASMFARMFDKQDAMNIGLGLALGGSKEKVDKVEKEYRANCSRVMPYDEIFLSSLRYTFAKDSFPVENELSLVN